MYVVFIIDDSIISVKLILNVGHYAVLNAERAAFHAPDFVTKLNNTRRIQLHGMVERYTEGAIPAERNSIFTRMSRSTN